MRKSATHALAALMLALSPVAAAAQEGHIEDIAFPWEGPFGSFDTLQLQRGLQIYTDVCSGCHGLQYLAFRELADEDGPEIPEDQVRAYAAAFPVIDELSNPQLRDETGELRTPLPSDHFPANHTQGAPDLTLMAKARAGFHGPYGLGINQFFRGVGGPEYIVGILTGYTGEEKQVAGETFYENTAFPGGWIKMPPPLADGQVDFEPAHDNSLHAEAQDIVSFLTWASEPRMMARKRAGFVAVAFMVLLSVLLYLTNKRIWAPYKDKAKAGA